MTVLSYSSIICQLSKLNLERRHLTSYRCMAHPLPQTSSDTAETKETNTVKYFYVTGNIFYTHLLVLQQLSESVVDGGQTRAAETHRLWSLYFQRKNIKRFSYSVKENSSGTIIKERRMSDLIGMKNIKVGVRYTVHSVHNKLEREVTTKQL